MRGQCAATIGWKCASTNRSAPSRPASRVVLYDGEVCLGGAVIAATDAPFGGLSASFIPAPPPSSGDLHPVLETFSMNEERVLALAGLFQACALAQQLANEGRCDEGAMEASVASIFRIDAPSVVGVYGKHLQRPAGPAHLIAQLDESDRDMSVTRMVVTVMRLERSLSAATGAAAKSCSRALSPRSARSSTSARTRARSPAAWPNSMRRRFRPSSRG